MGQPACSVGGVRTKSILPFLPFVVFTKVQGITNQWEIYCYVFVTWYGDKNNELRNDALRDPRGGKIS